MIGGIGTELGDASNELVEKKFLRDAQHIRN